MKSILVILTSAIFLTCGMARMKKVETSKLENGSHLIKCNGNEGLCESEAKVVCGRDKYTVLKDSIIRKEDVLEWQGFGAGMVHKVKKELTVQCK